MKINTDVAFSIIILILIKHTLICCIYVVIFEWKIFRNWLSDFDLKIIASCHNFENDFSKFSQNIVIQKLPCIQ